MRAPTSQARWLVTYATRREAWSGRVRVVVRARSAAAALAKIPALRGRAVTALSLLVTPA